MVRDLSEKGPIGEYRSDNRLRWQKLVAQTEQPKMKNDKLIIKIYCS
jgi:hypothetical protein